MTEVFPRVGEWNKRCREKVRGIIAEEFGKTASGQMSSRSEMPEN